MSNGRKFRRHAKREMITLNVGVPPDRKILPGHLIELERVDNERIVIRCSCGDRWSGVPSERETLERKAYDHFMPKKVTNA